jgi:hypothetical protein
MPSMNSHAVSAYERRARKVPPGTWNAQRVIAALQDWVKEFGQPPRTHEWKSPRERHHGLGRARRWARAYPRWPSATTVAHYFGSWEAAIEAAGVRERWLGPFELPLQERVAAAHRMRGYRISTSDIASYLNVCTRTVEPSGKPATRPMRDRQPRRSTTTSAAGRQRSAQPSASLRIVPVHRRRGGPCDPVSIPVRPGRPSSTVLQKVKQTRCTVPERDSFRW